MKIVLFILSSLFLTACSSTNSTDMTEKNIKSCNTESTQACDKSQKCYAEKYALDKTGAQIVSKVSGCTTN